MKINSDYRMVLKAGKFIDRSLYRKQRESGFVLFFCIIAALVLIMFCCAISDASAQTIQPATEQGRIPAKDDCQDPETLSPELRKAYYQLKELEKEMDGMTVKIVCRKGVR